MSYEQMGYGGLGGLIIAALGILGMHKRIDKKQNKEVCNALHTAINSGFEGLKESLKDQKEDIKYVRSRIDDLVNGKRL